MLQAPGTNFGNIRMGSLQDINLTFPYLITVTTTKGGNQPVALVQMDDGSVPNLNMWPITAPVNNTWGSGTSPDRRGARFRLPGPARLSGIALYGDIDNPVDIVFYDSDGTTATVLASLISGYRAGTVGGPQKIIFNTKKTLLANTWYRLVFLPTSASSIVITELQLTSAAYQTGLPGGDSFMWTTVNGAPGSEAAWTNTTTSRMYGGLVFDQIDDGASVNTTGATSGAYIG